MPTAVEISPRQYGWALLTVATAIVPHVLWLTLEAVLLPLAFLGLCWWRTRQHGSVQTVPTVAKLLLIALLCAVVIGRYGTLFGRMPGASLLVIMLALKAAECRQARDVRVMVSIAFFVIVAAFLFNDSALLVLYMLFATGLGFAAMEALEQRQGEQSLLFASLGWRQVLTLMLVSVPLTIVLWLFFPRISTPFWGTPEQAGKTGLSDRMRPGDITELLTDDSPVLRISFEGATPPRNQLYFRGPTLWHYDGAEWRGSEFSLFSRRPTEQRADISYTVYQEPTERRWLFVLDRPVAINIDAHWTTDRQLIAAHPLVGAVSYTASSQLRGPYSRERLSEPARSAALNLPPGFDPRTHALGSDLRARFGRGGDRQIVQAVLAMFTEQEFAYSLSPPPLGRNRMDDFLFETRTGFCEHYASAFVGVLRAAGIPARPVTGYLGGVYNPVGGYLTVRNSDAHAWTEVWLDGDWERYDPTAAIAPDRVDTEGGSALRAPTGLWAGLGQRWDALGQYWRNFVVQFNALKQSALLRPFGIEQATWEHLGMALAGFGALAAALAGWLLWRKRLPPSRDPWIRGWHLLRRKLRKAGLELPIALGPAATAELCRSRLGKAAQQVLPLLQQFEAVHYAQAATDPAQLKQWRRAIQRLRIRPPESS